MKNLIVLSFLVWYYMKNLIVLSFLVWFTIQIFLSPYGDCPIYTFFYKK